MNLLRLARLPLVLLSVTCALITSASALNFPVLTGRVVDDAHILDAASRTSLTEKLTALETRTTDQVVVATVKSLGGTSIEDYANQLFRQWQLGQKNKNNGVLLLVTPDEHKVRIEVGYGLEGTLTDAISKVIIENAIVPYFRANDFSGGINQGVDDIIQILSGDSEPFKRWAAQARERVTNAYVIDVSENSFLYRLLAALAWLMPILIGSAIALLLLVAIVGAAVGVATQLGFVPKRRHGFWQYLDYLPNNGGTSSNAREHESYGSSSSSPGASTGFSGGGGSSGGGGASGSW